MHRQFLSIPSCVLVSVLLHFIVANFSFTNICCFFRGNLAFLHWIKFTLLCFQMKYLLTRLICYFFMTGMFWALIIDYFGAISDIWVISMSTLPFHTILFSVDFNCLAMTPKMHAWVYYLEVFKSCTLGEIIFSAQNRPDLNALINRRGGSLRHAIFKCFHKSLYSLY